MFAEGASDRIKVDTFMYPPESEDFAEGGKWNLEQAVESVVPISNNAHYLHGVDASRLDTWVFNKFDELLESAKRNDTLNEMMRQDGVVFFLQYVR